MIFQYLKPHSIIKIPYNFINNKKEEMSCFFGKSSKQKTQPYKYKNTQKKYFVQQKKVKTYSQKFNATSYQLYLKALNQKKYASTHQQIFRNININALGKNQSVKNIDFSVLSCSINTLLSHVKYIIIEENQRKAQTNKFNLDLLIFKIAESYKSYSYHNFSHAFSTLLLLYQSYAISAKLQGLFNQREWLFIFIAALAHDINHPGTNNVFQNRKNYKQSKQAYQQSILQKFHLSYLWNLLENNAQINFLLSYQPQQANQIKYLITRLILSTDMAKHNQKTNHLKAIAQKSDDITRQQSYIVAEGLFHACDVGNPCLNYDNYSNWAMLIALQFDNLAEMEESMGFEVSDLLKFQGMTKFYQNQKGFCTHIVLPIWKQIKSIFNELIVFTNNIESNIKLLELEIQKK